MVKLQSIYYSHEKFPCLLVEHFQLGLLTWKDDVRKWFIGNSETHYQFDETYVPKKYRNNKVTVHRSYYLTFKRFSDHQQRTSVKEEFQFQFQFIVLP